MKTSVRKTKREILFPIGALVLSKGVDQLVREGHFDPMPYVQRHLCGEGKSGDQSAFHINNAVDRVGECLSSFHLSTCDLHILIVTNAERSATRVSLLNEEGDAHELVQ
nr:hypothetical protein FFPRI1PSEUD_24190 [Pseudomonas sp. FFPRI_1]